MNFENDLPSAAATAREKVQSALMSARERTTEVVTRGEQCVRERPWLIVGCAFALGLAIGVLAASRPAPKPRRGAFAESLSDSKDLLADALGAVASQLRGPIRRTVCSVSHRASDLGGSLAGVLDRVPRKLRWW